MRITTILVAMVVGIVAVILVCCILLFLSRYRSAMVQSARTSSAQAVSQVSNTVGSYLSDMDQAMELGRTVRLQLRREPGRAALRLPQIQAGRRGRDQLLTGRGAAGLLGYRPGAQGRHIQEPLLRLREGPRFRGRLPHRAARRDHLRGLLSLGGHDDVEGSMPGARPPGSRWI